MNEAVSPLKAQEPWIGPRARIAVIIPSTNIGVEYDCQQMILPGVTWHFCRFHVEQPDLSTDDMFLAFVQAIRHTIPNAMRDAMTCEPTQIMMGMSAETFWGGLEGNAEFTARLREVVGDEIGISTGANALDESLKVFGAKKVAALTPYQSVGDEQVRRFLEETGYEVSKVIGLKCDSATSIAHTPPSEVIDVVLNELEGSDVDAIVQAGTNLSAVNQFPALEQLLGKPVIPINVATIWHTFRTIGIQDKIFGKGWLFERF